MSAEETKPRDKLAGTVHGIGRTLATLEPGALADLRRMSLDGEAFGAPYFWRLAARHDLRQEKTWARIVQIMAILTDKGREEGKASPHASRSENNNWRGLGHALCDGGDWNWGLGQLEPRPLLSEVRFARLLAAKSVMRAELMRRAARALAAKKPHSVGVDCADLAKFLLFETEPKYARRLARDYYARFDGAARASNPGNTDSEIETGETE